MNAKNPVLWISLFIIALFAGLGVTRAQTGTNADVVATITNLENDGVKACIWRIVKGNRFLPVIALRTCESGLSLIFGGSWWQ